LSRRSLNAVQLITYITLYTTFVLSTSSQKEQALGSFFAVIGKQ